MNYEETLQYLYRQLPVFQQVGQSAYKPGLGNSLALDRLVGYPHRRYATIHIAGTNGKGSTSHVLAAVLQKSGYKVGLYTSPHLADFRERIRVDGEMITREAVLEFVDKYLEPSREIHPSFFELTMMMAFDYFASCHVNLIQLNNIPDSPFRPSPIEKVETLQRRLTMHGVETTIRNSRGSDIDAACGQLKQRRFRVQ